MKTPKKITKLNADKARPAKATGNACATAGRLSEMTLVNTHQIAQSTGPADSPRHKITAKAMALSGHPILINRSPSQLALKSHGITHPHARNANSVLALTRNSPAAAAAGVRSPTWVSHGPIHSDCIAINPP